MTTNAFRHRPPEQCTLSKEDQQHILRISNNDQELLDELMAILRQLRPLPPRGASVRHTTGDVTDARNRCRAHPPGAVSSPGGSRSQATAPATRATASTAFVRPGGRTVLHFANNFVS